MITVRGRVSMAMDGSVDGYVSQLESALGKETFKPLVNQLRLDTSIDQKEMVAIASKFWGYNVAKSTSRNKA